jgi:hypothetical protein
MIKLMNNMRHILTLLLSIFLFSRAAVVWAAVPSVDTATAAQTSGGSQASFNLTESAATTLYVHGSITDADGCEDVAVNGTVTGKFYRSNLGAADSCTNDNNDCYPLLNSNCTKTGCSGPGDNVFNYECTAEVQYYADSTTAGPQSSTDWTAKVKATDQATNVGTLTDTIEMNTLIGLDVPANMSHGSIALDTVGPEQTFIVTNSGNSGIDTNLKVDGAMICDGQGSQNIPAGNTHYSGTTGFNWADGTALTTAFVEYELNLGPRINDATAITKDLFFKLKMPVSGLRGTCNNTLTATALADVEGGW